MSKRALKKYLASLPKPALEEQVMDLYERFAPVKKYYDFAFNPKEDKLIQEAKSRISNEYFPVKRRRPRARRSVAQKYIRQFRTLGMAPFLIADLMLFNLEIAQTFSREKKVPEAFYRSMLNSFTEATQYLVQEALLSDFKDRILSIYEEISIQEWPLKDGFNRAIDILDLD
ncbi:DUF6155 family protein [Lentiprolixibacter aurantiacus]|uniref:DUF6155 family protein n=1 Tax=Lentiprolixibacter aurantiacus TaxID=2993939 RepID=A0AAE3MMJ1_9FLAO|nr:DUF6155 family protein [Lentiprolixibacter aurantiacus]